MGKNKGTAAPGKKRGQRELWTSADHQERNVAKQQKAKGKSNKKQERAALLDHGTSEQKEAQKLNLHISKTKRTVDSMRERLKQWDAIKEEQREKELNEKLRKQQEEMAAKEAGIVKKRQRLGPETWKLRGAARPAWEVYDFDTRYVDPHAKALEEAKASVQRSQNLLMLYKNKFGDSESPSICREYLGLLMQLGLLYRQANKIKAARAIFLEALDLDSLDKPFTLARCHLLRLYLQADRPESIQRLLDRLPKNDNSVWIQYSRVLIEHRKCMDGDSSALEAAFSVAVNVNVYCAFYLSFGDSFDKAIEYAEEIEDATDKEPLEEAIEYCNSEQRKAWEDASGLQEWTQSVILAVLKGKKEMCGITPLDLDWKTRLERIEEAAKAYLGDDRDEEEMEVTETEDEVDVIMFAGMFRTAMEMVEDLHGIAHQSRH